MRAVRAAQIVELGKPPKAVELEGEAEGPIEIAAVALNPLDLAVAAGRFYGGHPPLRYPKRGRASARHRAGALASDGIGQAGLHQSRIPGAADTPGSPLPVGATLSSDCETRRPDRLNHSAHRIMNGHGFVVVISRSHPIGIR